MTDDTTTWLKKNPVINPLRRSLKTSFMFHVPGSDMDASIISNPDKVNDQQIFIPRMLQRTNMRTLKSRTHEFKVPQLVVTKSSVKKSGLGSGSKSKNVPAQSRKSCLPVPNSKNQVPERKSTVNSLPRQSLAPRVPGQGSSVKRQIIQKMVEINQLSRNRKPAAQTHLKAAPTVSADDSVPRSILKKKRISLRRNSKISAEKPKAKKVLFNGFESSDAEEKENDVGVPVVENEAVEESEIFDASDEPTVFLNFPNSQKMEETPAEESCKEESNLKSSHTGPTSLVEDSNIMNIINIYQEYQKNVNTLNSMRLSWENSFEGFLQEIVVIRDTYNSYRRNSEEIYNELTKLGEKLEESLKEALTSGEKSEKVRRRSTGRKGSDKDDKIKISDKSKAIKKNSGKKSVPPLKDKALMELGESFNLINKKSFLKN